MKNYVTYSRKELLKVGKERLKGKGTHYPNIDIPDCNISQEEYKPYLAVFHTMIENNDFM